MSELTKQPITREWIDSIKEEYSDSEIIQSIIAYPKDSLGIIKKLISEVERLQEEKLVKDKVIEQMRKSCTDLVERNGEKDKVIEELEKEKFTELQRRYMYSAMSSMRIQFLKNNPEDRDNDCVKVYEEIISKLSD